MQLLDRPSAVETAPRERSADLRRWLDAGVLVALLVVAGLTLTSAGPGGWSWADPLVELRWYAAGWDDPGTVVQLVGNLLLLAPLAVLGVLRWPGLRSPGVLVATALLVGTTIEVLQWVLPLDRVVSPLDAVLNAAGAVVAGVLVAAVLRRRAGLVPAHPAQPYDRQSCGPGCLSSSWSSCCSAGAARTTAAPVRRPRGAHRR